MKPVTEDQVQALLSGLERREKEALRALTDTTSATSRSAGQLTAKVFRLGEKTSRPRPDAEGDVIEIESKRRERRRRTSSKGFLFYTSEARAAPTS